MPLKRKENTDDTVMFKIFWDIFPDPFEFQLISDFLFHKVILFSFRHDGKSE